MNIFVSDLDPVIAAQNLPDILSSKMCVELCQLLSTAHVELDGQQVAYKATHKNHPCAIFVRKEASNYQWVYEHYKALCAEFEHRKGKTHKSSEHLDTLANPPKNIPHKFGKRTFFPKCMPDEFKQKDVCESYKNYLNAKYREWLQRDKPLKVEWSNRDKPAWIEV